MSNQEILKERILDWEDWLSDRNREGNPRYRGRDYINAWRVIQDLKQHLTDDNDDKTFQSML